MGSVQSCTPLVLTETGTGRTAPEQEKPTTAGGKPGQIAQEAKTIEVTCLWRFDRLCLEKTISQRKNGIALMTFGTYYCTTRATNSVEHPAYPFHFHFRREFSFGYFPHSLTGELFTIKELTKDTIQSRTIYAW